MKRPLSDWQWALRELVCLFLGHKWKCSWHRNQVPFADDDYDQLPYRARHTGNPFFEYSAGWAYKCRRCRYRTRDHTFDPIYVAYYRAGRLFFRSVASSWSFRKDPHIVIRSKPWFLAWCGLAGLSQFLMYISDERHWPRFAENMVLDAEWHAADKAFAE